MKKKKPDVQRRGEKGKKGKKCMEIPQLTFSIGIPLISNF